MRTKCNRMDLIKNLNLWGNDLEDISVLQYMPNLEVLSLSVNCVNSLADLKSCLKLSELYLRKNEIRDLSEVLHLRHLRQMKVLWLSDNPCATLPHYRQYVLHHLPNLAKFDSLDVTEEERRSAIEADIGGMQTCVEGGQQQPQYEDANQMDMPDCSPSQQRHTSDPTLQFDVPPCSRSSNRREQDMTLDQSGMNSGGMELYSEENLLLEQRPPVDDDRPATRAGAQARGRRSFEADAPETFNGRSSMDAVGARSMGLDSASEWGGGRPIRTQSGNDVMDPSRSAEFPRGDLTRDFRESRETAAMRNSQARPVPQSQSPAIASPQYQQQRRPSGGAASPGERELGGEAARREAWSQEYAHERAPPSRASGQPGPPARASGYPPSNMRQNVAVEQSPNAPSSQSWSDQEGASPAQPLSATDNILCAVLALIKELDTQGLELVRRAVEQRQEDGL